MRELNIKNHRVNKKNQWAFDLPEHSNEHFDISLHKLMGATGHTQWTLSKALGVSNTTISNYLSGKREIISGNKELNDKYEFMRLVADILDVKPSYFLEYRFINLCHKLKPYPELVDVFIDLANDPKAVIDWWHMKNPTMPK